MTVFNVKDFGAIGNGCTADDMAIQEAINIATREGGAVYLPTGEYLITETLQCENSSQVRIFGYGTEHYREKHKTGAMITIPDGWPKEFDLDPVAGGDLPETGKALVAVKEEHEGSYSVRIFDRLETMVVDRQECSSVQNSECKLSPDVIELLEMAFTGTIGERQKSTLLHNLARQVGYLTPQDKPIFRITGSEPNRSGGMIFEGFSILADANRNLGANVGLGFHVTKRPVNDRDNQGNEIVKFWGNILWRDIYCRHLKVGICVDDPVPNDGEGFGWLHVNNSRLEDCDWGFMTLCTVNDLTLRDSIIRHSQVPATGYLSAQNGGGAHLRYGTQLVVDGCDLEGQRLGIYSGMRHAAITNNYFETMHDVSISIQGAQNVDIRNNYTKYDSRGVPEGPNTHYTYINNCDRVNYEGNSGVMVIGEQCRNITTDRPVVFLPVVIDTNSGAVPPPHQIAEIRNSGYYISEPFFSNTLVNQVDPNNEQYPQNSNDPSFTLKLTNGAMYDRDDNNEVRKFLGPFGLPFWKVTATVPNAGVILERKWSDLQVGEWLGIRLWMRFSETEANATLLNFQRIIEFQDNNEPSWEHQGTLDTSQIALEDLMGKWYTLNWFHQVEENESRLHIVAQFGIPPKEKNGSFDSRSMDITGFQSFRTLHPFVIPDSLEFGD